MAGSRRRLGFEALLLASIALGLPEFGAGCVTVISLENRPCPCASGYDWCLTTQTCLTEITCISLSPGQGSGGSFQASLSARQTLTVWVDVREPRFRGFPSR